MTRPQDSDVPTKVETILKGFREHLVDRRGLNRPPEIEDPTLHASGFSDLSLTGILRYQENSHDEDTPFALRIHRRHGVMRDFFLRFPVQFRSLELLEDTPVRSPTPYWYESDESYLGVPFFVMECFQGHVPVERSREDRDFMEQLASREEARASMVRQLVELHTLDWEERLFGEEDPPPGTTIGNPPGNQRDGSQHQGVELEVPRSGTGSVELLLEDLEKQFSRAQYEPRPVVRDGFKWARNNIPEPEANVLTHGDYRPGNFSFRNGELEGILDWEMLRVADPMHDVSWVLSPLGKGKTGRFWNVFERGRFIEMYEDLSPFSVSDHKLHYYHVLHLLIAIISWESGVATRRTDSSGDLRMTRMHYSIPPMLDLLARELGY